MKATTQALIERLTPNTLELLQGFPKAGQRHDWMIRVTGGLKSRVPEPLTRALLRKVREEGKMQDFTDQELESIVDYCYGSSEGKRCAEKAPKWPAANAEAIERVLELIEPGFDVEGL